ncbi:MAG TPA: serine hydrolase, partial [Burkholderiales bacterium]|nr:serine hydrolase [Burkholderiales bacterium]
MRGAVLLAVLFAASSAWTQPYYPDATWQRKSAAEVGLDAQRLKEAVDFAIAAESKNPRDLTLNHYQTFGREPHGNPIGPIKDRGDPTGVIVRRGYLVAEWGEPLRIDMTHSVTKSLLSSVAGVAYDRGLIRSIDDPVRDYVPPIVVDGDTALLHLFDTPHNRQITWNHLLRQTSDWEGTLWGKPDWADRPGDKPQEWLTRKRNAPGTAYK